MRRAEASSRQADAPGSIKEWMTHRWDHLEQNGVEPEAESQSAPSALELARNDESAAARDRAAPRPMDLGLRFRAAKPGDSISGLIGSSDPRAIGKFLSLNGMDGRSSTLRVGRSYVVPTAWDDATPAEGKIGQKVLGIDNAQLAGRAEREADAARRARLFDRGLNVWTGMPVEFQPPAGPRQSGASKVVSLDENPMAKGAVGALGWALGLAPGVFRGGSNTLKGSVDGALFVNRLASPIDLVLNAPGQSARDQLLNVGLQIADYAERGIRDPSIVRDDIASGLHDFNLRQNPFATPAADTIGREFNRTFDIGMNNGELAFEVGSTVVGGEFMRGAMGLGAAAKAADATELTFLANNPGFAARLDQLYGGMSHHIVRRGAKLPEWLGGGPYPQWLIESEFNKIGHEGMTTRDVYRNHVGVDPHFRGGKVGRKYGGTRWSAERDLGWTDYGPWDRLNFGTSPYTKAVVGPVLAGGTVTDSFEERGW